MVGVTEFRRSQELNRYDISMKQFRIHIMARDYPVEEAKAEESWGSIGDVLIIKIYLSGRHVSLHLLSTKQRNKI